MLGDLHGHLTLAYRLLKRWEQERKEQIDCILQVGDLGAYPHALRLDKATMRFAKKDPDELGFIDYHNGCQEADGILGFDAPEATRIDAYMYFVKGNHDDFEFLDEMSSYGDGPIYVDRYGKILYVPNGTVWDLELGGRTITLAALGGVACRDRSKPGPISPYFSKAEVRQLATCDRRIDVLLTHEPGYGSFRHNMGSWDGRDLIKELRPRYHFCGHYHEEGTALRAPEGTESFLLNEVNFHGSRRLRKGCIGILRWQGRDHTSFSFVEDPWLDAYTRADYRTLKRDE